ncbi:hypothetical protein [Kribbella sp. HUAS MG21]|uniref:Uncharacterized protein n=1 Tax=Kribbella sp. HUAS MG21 TaxID=3160966 RepID=A0AAU7TKP3_9ACTN
MVTSFAELMEVQADIAVATLGAHHSAWNKRYEVLPRDDGRVSRVTWDGTIQYTPEDVVDPLQEMFDRAYLQHDAETLARFREAVRTVLHENIHLLSGPGTSLAFPLDDFEGRAHKIFEEAVTERATQNEIGNYIDRLGLEQIAPGISRAPASHVYAAYVRAVDVFSETVGADVGLDSAEVIRRMAVVNSAEKYRVAAELLYTKHLRHLVPETAKADAINRIATAMHAPFAAIHGYNGGDPSDVRLAGLAGRSAYQKADEQIRSIAEHWSENQDLRQALDAGLGATTPLHKPHQTKTTDDPRAEAGDSPQTPTWNAKRPETRQPPPGRSPHD